MDKMNNYDKWMGILSISVIAIVAVVFISITSGTHLAKGTYAYNASYTGISKSQRDTYAQLGYSCVKATAAKTQAKCTCTNTSGCTTTSGTQPYNSVIDPVDVGSTGTMSTFGYTCSSYETEETYNCTCSSPKVVTASGCVNDSSSESGSSEEATTCAAGTYFYDGQQKCEPCLTGYYCPGVVGYNGDSRKGITKCPDGYTSDGTTATKQTDCYITCSENEMLPNPTASKCQKCSTGWTSNGGKVNYGSSSSCAKVETNKCGDGTYFDSTTSECKTCPIGYTSPLSGADSINDCYINCSAGSYLAETKASSCMQCGKGTTTSQHSVNYGKTSADIGKSCVRSNTDTPTTPDSPSTPSTPSTPSNPSTPDTPTTDTGKCYVKDHQYVWATSQPANSGLVSSITTADKCKGCETGYAADSNNKCVKPDSPSGGGSSDDPSNPQTGSSSVVLVWMIGLMAIGYSVWYFKRSTNN